MLDLIIRGGQVVTPQAVGEMDVGIQGEKIATVGWPGTLAADAGRVIDARGKIVLPGGIEPHAHIVLINPALKKTLTLDDLHADSDYSIWEGFTCQGYPVMTLLRGKVIVEDGKLVGSSSDGRWVKRRVSGDVLSRPVV